jgi:MFS family permease
MMSKMRLLFGVSLFWLGLSMLSDGLNTLVLPSHLFHFTTEANRATILGLLTFAGLLVGLLIQPIAGMFSDRLQSRWGRRGTIGMGVLLTLLALTAFSFTRSLVAVILSYSMIQVSANLAQAAQQGFIPDLVPTHWRGTAAGLKGVMDFGGAFLGFAVLGPLLGTGKIGLPIFAIAAILVLTLLLTMMLVREPLQPAYPMPTRFSLREVFQLDLREHRSFAWLIASRFLFLLGAYAVNRFFLFFIADRLGLDLARAAEESGSLLAGLTLITVLAAPLTGWMADRWGRFLMMFSGVVLSVLGVLLLIQAKSSLSILLFGGLMAIGTAAFTGANWAMTADLTPPSEGGRFLGLANVGTAGAAAAAGLFGPLVDWGNGFAPGAGYSVVFVFSALAFVASLISLRRAGRLHRQLATKQVPEV